MFFNQKLVLTIISIILIPTLVYSQKITGKILDANTATPLVGANITQLGTTNGTVSSSKGTFTLNLVTNKPKKLVVSYIGYERKEVSIADQTDSASQLIIRLREQGFESKPLTVNAVRADEKDPVTQTTILKSNLENVYVGEDPVFALEELTPSILAHSESGSGFANYSLMRMRGIDQSRINITLNGVPLNDMIDQGVFFSNFTDFGNSVQSVQIQRGVGSSTNGTASYAGSINFESQRIRLGEPSATINLTGGSFNSYRAGAEVQTGSMKDNFGMYSKFTKTLSEGYKFHSGTNATSFFFSGGYFGEDHVIKVTSFFGRTRNELAYLPVLIDNIRDEPKTNALSENDKDDFSQQLVQVEHSTNLSEKLLINSSIYYGAAGGDFPFGFTGQNGSFTQQNFRLENDHYGLMTSLMYDPLENFNITAGIHTYRFDRINEEAFVPDLQNPYYADDSRKDEFSTFIKADYSIGQFSVYGDLQIRSVWLDLDPDKSFLVSSGLSAENLGVPTRSWTYLNPKVGVTYDLNSTIDLYASFGISGREPTRSDILGTTNINPSNLDVVQNTNSVRSEYVQDWEGGLRIQAGRLNAKLNGFYMDFDNEISATGAFIPAGFVQLRQNIENSHRAGVELQWQWQPFYKLQLSGNTTYMQSNINTFSPGGTNQTFRDVEAILSPEWLLNATAAYQVNRWLQATFSGRYVSDSFLELTNQTDLKLPSFFKLDAGLNVSFSDRLSGNIRIQNLTDKLYFTNGAPVDADGDGTIDGPGFLVQPPLHVFAEFKIHI